MDDGTGYQKHGSATANRAGDGILANRPETLTQEEMSEIMFRARTLELIAVSWSVRSAYLLAHPDDEAIMEEGEALRMREPALLPSSYNHFFSAHLKKLRSR